jgi:hypothetical protein
MTCLTAVIHSLGQLGQPGLLLTAAEHPVLGERFEAVGRQADITLLNTSSVLVFVYNNLLALLGDSLEEQDNHAGDDEDGEGAEDNNEYNKRKSISQIFNIFTLSVHAQRVTYNISQEHGVEVSDYKFDF